ncbi:MAG: universal stress protein [Chromatiaceae bacterium]|nr:universal stress protein [Chromatiaceae bacterium]
MFKQILVPIDLEETELSGRAIAVAEDLAAHYGAQLTALTVIPDFSNAMVASYFPEDAIKKAHDEICGELRKFVDQRFKNPTKVYCAVGEGSPRKVIVRHVKEHSIDLVVMPARKTDISKMFLGSNSSHVVDHARCSVLVVKN